MNARNLAVRLEGNGSEQALEAMGRGVLRYGLAGTLLLVGALKFVEYEAENIRPMVSTSSLFSWIIRRMGLRKTAGLIGVW